MKIPLVLTLVGLAITFALPAFAQQKDAADPEITQKIRAISKGYDEASNNNNAAGIAAAASPLSNFNRKRIELAALPPSKVEYIELAIGSVLTFKRFRNPHRLLNVWIGR